MRKNIIKAIVVAALTLTASAASAVQIIWTDWTAATVGDVGSATGSMTIGAQTIGVHYAGQVLGAQTDGDTNYWIPSAPYLSTTVSNAPATADIIQISGQDNNQITNTITFDTALLDPVMALLSLGQSGTDVYYRFDQDFNLLSSGKGYWGGDPAGSLFDDGDYVLRGVEGHGAIQFIGAVTSISWTADPSEYWHGFTVGAAEAAPVPEPGTFLLLGAGLGGLAFWRRRTAKK